MPYEEDGFTRTLRAILTEYHGENPLATYIAGCVDLYDDAVKEKRAIAVKPKPKLKFKVHSEDTGGAVYYRGPDGKAKTAEE